MVLDRVEHPIVLAPLAGGPSTPALTAAVCEAGGLGLLATGYLSAAQTSEAIAKTRELTSALLPLLQAARRAVEIPLIATGGIATGEGLAAVLAAGARAAQLGTAFMLCPEAGTSSAHRDAIASDEPTQLTRAFSGRLARGIRNRFMTEHHDAPVAYPEIHYVTAPLRRYAREHADGDMINLWAGEAHALARAVPAVQVVARLAAEAETALAAARAHVPGRKPGDDRATALGTQSRARLSELAARWYDDWNAHDLERILSHYTDDIVFSSPFIVHLGADPSGTLIGKDALRVYWSRALERYPEMHFEPVAETHGVRSLVLHYRGVGGIRACEMLELDDSGLVARSLAHYEPPLLGDD